MASHLLSEALIRAVERTRAEYKVERVRRLLASGLEDHVFRVAEIGDVLVTDWRPMPRAFCLDHTQLDRLEEVLAWYAEVDRAPHLEVLPLQGNQPLFEALARHGFALRYVIGVLLTEAGGDAPAQPGIRVSPDEEIAAWSDVYIDAHGWECSDDERGRWVPELSVQYLHPAVTRYVAEVDGEIAAVAASWHPGGAHAHLTNCATLRPHRGRGLHAALIRQRLHDLGAAGAVHAAADTTPYSTSHRNLERAGFRLAYQKTHWERPA